MAKSKKLVIVKDPNCLNCGFPFSGQEKFCPECGQKNKGDKLTFGTFVKEVFNGFITWDAKFWKTIVPLIISPGKVSRDYIEGKRMRYTNPFRFYITTSLLFFVIYGFISSYNRFEELRNGKTSKKETSISEIINKSQKEVDMDSVKNEVSKNLDNAFIPKAAKEEIIKSIDEQAKDSTKQNSGRISFGGDTRLDKFIAFQKEYPNAPIDEALDSLKFEKTFTNRVLYNRAVLANSLVSGDVDWREFTDEMLSNGSISLFILLPIFTLFLKFFYIRRKFTYVEHLIFVFHTQTVFFILLLLFVLLDFFGKTSQEWLFIVLFLAYLFIGMKKFYQQGYFKTFFKFILVNWVYMILATIGTVIVGLASFMFM